MDTVIKCDICDAEVTGFDSISVGDYTVCMVRRKYDIYLTRDHGVILTCEHLVNLYMRYPELGNVTWLNRKRIIEIEETK